MAKNNDLVVPYLTNSLENTAFKLILILGYVTKYLKILRVM